MTETDRRTDNLVTVLDNYEYNSTMALTNGKARQIVELNDQHSN